MRQESKLKKRSITEHTCGIKGTSNVIQQQNRFVQLVCQFYKLAEEPNKKSMNKKLHCIEMIYEINQEYTQNQRSHERMNCRINK
jgi:hypothetical protein